MFIVDGLVGIILFIWFSLAFIAIVVLTFDPFFIPFIPNTNHCYCGWNGKERGRYESHFRGGNGETFN